MIKEVRAALHGIPLSPASVPAGVTPTPRSLNILVLAEGDAETRDAWSGIGNSVVEHFRKLGHTVQVADVDLYGSLRYAAAALSYSPRRERWRARFRLGRAGAWLRSLLARRAIRRAGGEVDLILQIGAAFEPRGRGSIPYAIYCDANIRVSEMHMDSGYTYANQLTARERVQVSERERRVYDGAAAIFTISDRLRQSFVNDFGIAEERVVTVHAGPNFEWPEPKAPDAPDARSSGGAPTILFVGRQFHRKGGDTLLSAFERIRRVLPDAQLVVIGPDRPEEIPPGVRWLGFLNKDRPADLETIRAEYRNADVFCLPTRFEPFGIVFLEAMAYGLPCVGSDVWAVPEMVRNGQTGFTVARDDVAALADRVLQLLRDPARAREMGRAGRALAVSHFTWDAVVQRMLAHLSQTLTSVAR